MRPSAPALILLAVAQVPFAVSLDLDWGPIFTLGATIPVWNCINVPYSPNGKAVNHALLRDLTNVTLNSTTVVKVARDVALVTGCFAMTPSRFRAVSPCLAHNLIGGSSHDWSFDNNHVYSTAIVGAGALTYPGVTQRQPLPSSVRDGRVWARGPIPDKELCQKMLYSWGWRAQTR